MGDADEHFLEGLQRREFAGKVAGPCVFVLFGAAGDLTKRKLLPSLFNLVRAKLLPDNFAVMGVSVDDLSVEAFRAQVSEFLPTGADAAAHLTWLHERLLYERGDFGDPNTFTRLRERLATIDTERNTQGNYLFYLATAPNAEKGVLIFRPNNLKKAFEVLS